MTIDRTIARPDYEKRNLFEHLAHRLSLRQFIFAIVLAFFLVSILFPFYWMVSSSFKSFAEIGGREAVYIPSELRLAGGMLTLIGIVAYLRFMDAPPKLGLVVGTSVFVSMVLAATIGTFVPILLKRLNIDPAIATGPFVTTSIDILGVLFYFVIATALLVE